jgi:thiosulfate reductase cytochrome b subunit
VHQAGRLPPTSHPPETIPRKSRLGLCYPPRVQSISPVQVQSTPVQSTPRHTVLVRITHWITVISFCALLLTGAEIVISHPRFYWGETGNSGTPALFTIPIPASRDTVPTGYGFVMPDQNGWSRYLHFEAAWVLVITGLVYLVAGLLTRHFSRNLFPAPADRKWQAFRDVLAKGLRRAPPDAPENRTYNAVQRTTYLLVIFVLFPLVIWTGLALSPAFNSAVPAAVNILGGRQSARTLHFFVSGFLVLFLIVHVAMIVLAGFWNRTRAMITGRVAVPSVPSVPLERP